MLLALVCASAGAAGPYKVTGRTEPAIPGYNLYYPEDLKSAAAIEGPLPVVFFGNGGCAEQPGNNQLLPEQASHGYIVLAVGRFTEFKKALDWLEAENLRPGSEFYGCVDVSRTAATGYSCGGLQALLMTAEGDPRVKTTILYCSGINPPDQPLSTAIEKDCLDRIDHPILYINGGPTDIAYKNGADDYSRITKVPVTSMNLPVGHGGTFNQPRGGQFATVGLRWLDWRLKGHDEYEDFFRYGKLEEGFEDWVIRAKNYNQLIKIDLPVDEYPDVEEKADVNEFGDVTNYSSVTRPFIMVSLPDPEKATGTAVLLFPGGGLQALSWDSDFREASAWFNARGIAAIGVKYRTRVSTPGARTGGAGAPGARPASPAAGAPAARPAVPAGAASPAAPSSESRTNVLYTGRAKITDFDQIVKANTAPSPTGSTDPINQKIIEDANHAIDIVRAHAAEWNIDPAKVGYLGYSAGGCVELAALTHCLPEQMPNFVVSVYGPSMMDVDVPENAPKLFIAVHADHPNVAAGCLALFLEWKKAGVDAELHVYGEGTGGLFGGAGWKGDHNTLNGYWMESLYSWLQANGF